MDGDAGNFEMTVTADAGFVGKFSMIERGESKITKGCMCEGV
jgi:hypothetical protein